MILEEFLHELTIDSDRVPEMDYSPLRNVEALSEATISEIDVSVIRGRAAVLFDLQTSLRLGDLGSAGALVCDGVESVSVEWPADRTEGRFATPVHEMSIVASGAGKYTTSISPILSSFRAIDVVSSAVPSSCWAQMC